MLILTKLFDRAAHIRFQFYWLWSRDWPHLNQRLFEIVQIFSQRIHIKCRFFDRLKSFTMLAKSKYANLAANKWYQIFVDLPLIAEALN